MLTRILYTSRATEGVTLRDAYDIIRVSHNRNSRAGITGGLVFADGYFIQLLEGLQSAVDERYRRIMKDERHCDILKRQETSIQDALFESEWMALRDGSTVDPKINAAHNYEPGFPQEKFGGEQILDWLLDCFDVKVSSSSS